MPLDERPGEGQQGERREEQPRQVQLRQPAGPGLRRPRRCEVAHQHHDGHGTHRQVQGEDPSPARRLHDRPSEQRTDRQRDRDGAGPDPGAVRLVALADVVRQHGEARRQHERGARALQHPRSTSTGTLDASAAGSDAIPKSANPNSRHCRRPNTSAARPRAAAHRRRPGCSWSRPTPDHSATGAGRAGWPAARSSPPCCRAS